jgi:hypothetical protein
MTMKMNNELCKTCGRAHTPGYNPQHPFNNGSRSGKDVFFAAVEDAVAVEQTSMPFDPVLRQALIDKGVLTVEDLRNAEAKIRAVTGVFNERRTRLDDDADMA